MNLLLIEKHELDGTGRVELHGRRAEHLLKVLKVEVGARLRAGVIGGGQGRAEVVEIRSETPAEGKKSTLVVVRLEVDESQAERPDLDLVLGLPRPAVLHRVLQHAAAIGVGRLELINAWRVEKSFFQSPSLRPEAIHRHLLLGLEQGQRTWLPEIRQHRLLVPFVESLGSAPAGEIRLIAHPDAEQAIEHVARPQECGRVVLAIGPEGGWIDRELDTFRSAGFAPASLGPWTLRSEAAVTAAIAQIAMLRRLGQSSA